MDVGDVVKGLVALLLGVLTTVTGWLANATVTSRDKIKDLEAKAAAIEKDVVAAEKKHEEKLRVLDEAIKSQKPLTLAEVQSAIEMALAKRDQSWETRRNDWERLRKYETQEAAMRAVNRTLEYLGIKGRGVALPPGSAFDESGHIEPPHTSGPGTGRGGV